MKKTVYRVRVDGKEYTRKSDRETPYTHAVAVLYPLGCVINVGNHGKDDSGWIIRSWASSEALAHKACNQFKNLGLETKVMVVL